MFKQSFSSCGRSPNRAAAQEPTRDGYLNAVQIYRVRGKYYIVDRLFAAAELRLGAEPQQIVRISRSDGTGGRGGRER